MENKNINLIDEEHFEPPKKSFFRKFLIYPVIILIIAFIAFTQNIIFSEEGFFQYFISGLKKYPINNDRTLAGEENNLITFLVLGMGGANHDGGKLTDTIMLASINPEDKKAALTSVPRDLLVDIPDYGKQKINHAYALTERDSPGSGGEIISAIISDILNVPVNYYIAVDFDIVVQLIDEIGGVDVYVENAFIDYQYPDYNHKYQTIHFEKGWQTMDGETALQFARSRHGICLEACSEPEGSDFARSKRQQLIIKSLKDKLLSLKTLTKPKEMYKLLEVYKNNVDTNIELWEMIKFYDIARDFDNDSISHLVLDNGPGGPLMAQNVNGAYVLVPKTGDFSEIQEMVNENIYGISVTNENLTDNNAPFEENIEKALIEIQNGTKISGLAAKTAETFERDKQIEISKISNAQKQTVEKTLVYDFTEGAKKDILNLIMKKLGNAQLAVNLPGDLFNDNSDTRSIIVDETVVTTVDTNTDFLIILGKDQEKL